MDNKQMVEDFLKAEGYEYNYDEENRGFFLRFHINIIPIYVCIRTPLCIDEDNDMFKDHQVVVYAHLESCIPDEKREVILKFINHVHSCNTSSSYLYLDEDINEISASIRFFVWENMDMSLFDMLLLAPIRHIDEYQKDFIRLLIDTDKESTEEGERKALNLN